MGKANHLKPTHPGGTTQHQDTPHAGEINIPGPWPQTGNSDGRDTGS